MGKLDAKRIGRFISAKLKVSLRNLPKEFHSTFKYTRTGNNYCHPITLSLIGDAVRQMGDVVHVGYDVRLNKGSGNKFQPDVVGFDAHITPIVCVDFESPNSSDARVMEKDVAAYARWAAAVQGKGETVPPYIIVTSLPNFTSDDWECRWTGAGKWNEGHKDYVTDIVANPFAYWNRIWAKQLADYRDQNIAFLNISDSKVMYVS